MKKKNIENFYQGIYSEKDYLCPSYINIQNPKYIEIDQMYYSTLVITNYNREQKELLLKALIDKNINMNISMFYEKQDNYKVIQDLTYHIGNVGADLKSFQDGRQDFDVAAFTYNDAKYIRRELQVNNEEIYFLYLYISLFSEDIKELESLLNTAEGVIQSKGMQVRRVNFRQEQAFKSCLPIMKNEEDLKRIAKRNVLTSGLVCTYPFISSTLFDEGGIFVGTNIYNDSLVFIDRYDTNKYKNANMCVFGTSGSGKSFYTKLIILRCFLLGISQYVIDPEREYYPLGKVLNATILKIGPSSDTYINILDIRQDSIEENEKGYLSIKITKLIGFFNLIFGKMNEEEKAILEGKLIKTYEKKNITFDDKSLYKKVNNKVKFKEAKDMPLLQDLYEILLEDENTKSFRIKLMPFIKGYLSFFNQYTNVELNNKLIIADVYDLGEENLKYGMYIFIDLFWDKIKSDRKNKKAIYLDEIWRLIGITSNENVASFIYKIFKTIRKYGGSSIAITQDVSDLFSLENGAYGKSILNNSSIKNFFCLEEENIRILEKHINLSELEKIEIKSLKKGECLMFVGEDHILTQIDCSTLEKNIVIEGEVYGEDDNCNERSVDK